MHDWIAALLASLRFVKSLENNGAEEHEDEGERAQPSVGDVIICCVLSNVEESHKFKLLSRIAPKPFVSSQWRKN